jgi:hypothetical protein
MVEQGEAGPVEIFEVVPVPDHLQGVQIVKRYVQFDFVAGIAYGAHGVLSQTRMVRLAAVRRRVIKMASYLPAFPFKSQ